MICVSITEKTTREAVRVAESLPPEVELVEVRGDLIQDIDVDAILGSISRRVIFTVRCLEQGGAFTGSEEERVNLLLRAKRSGAAYVDVESCTAEELKRQVLTGPGDAKVILSFHDFLGTPTDLFALARELYREPVDVVKIVTFARTLEDNFRIFRLLRHMKGRMVAHAMGELGFISRILAPKFGSLWTYTYLQGASPAAPGQIDLDTLLDVYHAHRVKPDTDVYAILGNPVGHSYSPHMHNAAFRHYDLNAVYVPVKVSDLTSVLSFFGDMGVKGCSVTIPFKVTIMDYLDSVTYLAGKMGATNTVTVRDGRLLGSNTDGLGALRTIQAAGIQLTGANVVILGAGGSARAVGYALGSALRLGSLTYASRRPDQAKILIKELFPHSSRKMQACGFSEVELGRAMAQADLVINCTPVGMHPHGDDTPVPSHLLREKPVVFDIVYHPLATRLLKEARAAGCLTLNGLEMLVHQGAAQFETWTGRRAPFKVMLEAVLRRVENVGGNLELPLSRDPFSS